MDLVTLFTATLAFSIVGLLSLFSIKAFEMKTGKVFLGSLRPKVGAFFHTVLMIVERAIPALVVYFVRRFATGTKRSVQQVVARAIVRIEQSLEGALQTLRYSTAPIQTSSREASVFLREVAEHKRKLLSSQTGHAVRE